MPLSRRSALLAAALAAGALTATAGAQSAVLRDGSTVITEKDPSVLAAAAQLAEDAHVTQTEAIARVTRQPAMSALEQALATKAADVFGGAWIDQVHGGRLQVAVTDTASPVVASLVGASGLTGHVDLVRTAITAKQLSAAYDAVSSTWAAHSTTAAPLQTLRDTEHQQVVVQHVAGTPFTADQAAYVAGLRATYGAAIGTGAFDRVAEPTACSFPSCDAPLRGGLWILSSQIPQLQGYEYCTSGFIVQNRTNPSIHYVLTAGHCLLGHHDGAAGTWYEKMSTTGLITAVGNGYKYVFNQTQGDAAIIRIDNTSVWNETGAVYVVACSSTTCPGHPRQETPLYTISRVATWPTTGSYLCHTGASIGTRCGKFTGRVNITTTAEGPIPARTLNDMGQVSMASCQGDSGGPVFVSGAGYGVLSAGSGTRSTRTGPGGSSVDCGTVAYYEDLTKGLNAMTVSLYTG